MLPDELDNGLLELLALDGAAGLLLLSLERHALGVWWVGSAKAACACSASDVLTKRHLGLLPSVASALHLDSLLFKLVLAQRSADTLLQGHAQLALTLRASSSSSFFWLTCSSFCSLPWSFSFDLSLSAKSCMRSSSCRFSCTLTVAQGRQR